MWGMLTVFTYIAKSPALSGVIICDRLYVDPEWPGLLIDSIDGYFAFMCSRSPLYFAMIFSPGTMLFGGCVKSYVEILTMLSISIKSGNAVERMCMSP